MILMKVFHQEWSWNRYFILSIIEVMKTGRLYSFSFVKRMDGNDKARHIIKYMDVH